MFFNTLHSFDIHFGFHASCTHDSWTTDKYDHHLLEELRLRWTRTNFVKSVAKRILEFASKISLEENTMKRGKYARKT